MQNKPTRRSRPTEGDLQAVFRPHGQHHIGPGRQGVPVDHVTSLRNAEVEARFGVDIPPARRGMDLVSELATVGRMDREGVDRPLEVGIGLLTDGRRHAPAALGEGDRAGGDSGVRVWLQLLAHEIVADDDLRDDFRLGRRSRIGQRHPLGFPRKSLGQQRLVIHENGQARRHKQQLHGLLHSAHEAIPAVDLSFTIDMQPLVPVCGRTQVDLMGCKVSAPEDERQPGSSLGDLRGDGAQLLAALEQGLFHPAGSLLSVGGREQLPQRRQVMAGPPQSDANRKSTKDNAGQDSMQDSGTRSIGHGGGWVAAKRGGLGSPQSRSENG